MSIHIGAQKGDIADTVLLPGDPLRAKFVADTYLDNDSCYNTVRNMLGNTGTYNGKRVSVQGSGMGMPSISIYATELITQYGVKRIMRIGSCGSLQEEIRIRDIILAQSASTNSAVNRIRFGGLIDYAPTADFALLMNAYNAAVKKGVYVRVGNIFSSDDFYSDNENWWKPMAEYGVLAVEMECAALYTVAAKYDVEALTFLTVSDSLVTGEATTSEERQSTFTEMMEIALAVI
ncbi:MAG: purine-nucleoside phosphorylase [Spirochaetota bacterium]